ncbi:MULTISPECIES: hypothetical protein [Streptomyces]|uniref:hypothetical protein n=1 Tax=Streptomyces TaxID=1883 RepID=UPI000AC12DB7|nr:MULTISPECIES: hypothetical protein [Streptomyces]MDH6224032.1 hypothetical protein [Streptomyces sp. MJP52]
MGTFKRFGTHSGFKCDFYLHIGPVEGAWENWSGWDGKRFGDQLWSDVGRGLRVPTESCPGSQDERVPSWYNYHFLDDDVSLKLYVEEPEPGDAYEVVPVSLDVISLWSEAGDVAERIYDWLDATGKYLLVAHEVGGMRVAANFEVPETD